MGKYLLLIALLFFISKSSFSQIEPGKIPDGTEGKTIEITEEDTIKKALTFENWNKFDGSLSTLNIGGGFLYEYAGYIQNDAGKQQMDSADVDIKHAFAVRDFRITLSGSLKNKRFISWKAGFMYDGEANPWFIRESGIMFGVPELAGYVFIGRTKEGFSMNKVMNGYAGWTLERANSLRCHSNSG